VPFRAKEAMLRWSQMRVLPFHVRTYGSSLSFSLVIFSTGPLAFSSRFRLSREKANPGAVTSPFIYSVLAASTSAADTSFTNANIWAQVTPTVFALLTKHDAPSGEGNTSTLARAASLQAVAKRPALRAAPKRPGAATWT